MNQLTKGAINALEATRESLFVKGWRKDGYGGLEGPNCLAGALVLNIYQVDTYRLAHETLTEIIGRGITRFNDADETTFDEVIDVIDLAIKTLEGMDG